MSRQLSNKPVSKDDAAEALNREIVPYIRDLSVRVSAAATSADAANAAAAQALAAATAATEAAESATTAADSAYLSAQTAISAAEAAAAAAAAAQAAADAAQDAVDDLTALKCNAAYSFQHPRLVSGTVNSRIMQHGFGATDLTEGATQLQSWAIMPHDGEIFNLTCRQINGPGAGTGIRYEVIRCSMTTSQASTTLTQTVTIAQNSTAAARDTTNVDTVSAGDLIGIRVVPLTISGTVPAVQLGGLWASFMFRRTV